MKAISTGQWVAVATSNFCGPQFVGMWRDITWHKRLTHLIRTSQVNEALRNQPQAQKLLHRVSIIANRPRARSRECQRDIGVSEPRHALLDPFALFESYLRVTGVAHLGRESERAPELLGKCLGLLNGSSWIALWSNFFGRRYLPGAQLVNAGKDAVQLNFMEAHARGEFYPSAANVRAFVRYAKDLVVLGRVDAILITCSTMNRFPCHRSCSATRSRKSSSACRF